MRLIDADALRRAMYHESMEKDSDEQMWNSGCWIRYKMFERILDEQPTIEPERKKGKWIKKEKIYPELPEDSDYRFECSLCGWSDQHNDKMIVPYCWHCGAEMRGEEHDND